ncbi:hypothetical protein BST97_08425 [Nonlabens spongiae]|uniref:HTH luxR-type domain-containing protein n=1 Tax=Nonlabens spongiae TaxID=331648 RepID=A0A1W6MKB3_9FLAO|nr:helix-turn-helix transcriptional regulator [Nonlabens spongiae]ARN78023.1 hypothetical protein BST97_08425 [Nonlabens spongiae]
MQYLNREKHTEKEFLQKGKHFAFKLRKLYLKDPEKFYDLQDYYPFPVYINHRKTIEYHFINEKFLGMGREVEPIVRNGKDYLLRVSNVPLFNRAMEKARTLDKNNDHQAVCNYLQAIRLNNEKEEPFVTSKILIDDALTMNVPLLFTGEDSFSQAFKEILPSNKQELQQFLRFQTLTKREKQITRLIGQGHSSKQIAEMLFISPHSVKTHRKNIYQKLDVHNVSTLLKLNLVNDLAG